MSVSSWLLYAPSYSDWLACTVSLSEEAKRAGRILPHINTAPTAVPGELVSYTNILPTIRSLSPHPTDTSLEEEEHVEKVSTDFFC